MKRKKRKQELPFKGRIKGNFVANPTSDTTVYNSVAHASGNVTHLGIFSKVTSDVVYFSTMKIKGKFTMTNSTGDKLNGKYTGSYSLGVTPGTFSWVLDAVITGGTGRFTNASGEFGFFADGNYDIVDGILSGNYTETIDGTMIY